MNGGASTSATDPHHRSSGYLGMGLPGLGVTPMTPPSGNGFAGPSLSGLGMSGGAVGPELKHHADFLSRLLAATPSYPSDVGNPPPGFFSDWLRRLVSKPGPGNGSSPPHAHHNSHRTGRGSGSPSAPTSIQQQTSSLTFSPTGGQAESNGAGPLESSAQHQGTSGGSSSVPKRRKRTRITDHHLHLTHQQHMTTTVRTIPSYPQDYFNTIEGNDSLELCSLDMSCQPYSYFLHSLGPFPLLYVSISCNLV